MRQSRADRSRGRARKGQRETVNRVWFDEHRGVFIFLLVFGALIGIFYAFISWTPIFNRVFMPAYHRFIAEISAKMLLFLGERTTVVGTSIISPRFSVQIVRGCDAIEATGLFMCAILAFPAGMIQKVTGIIAGVIILAVINLVRIVSLFLIGINFPGLVDFMHIEVWQGMFIIFAVILWVVWLLWITRNPAHIQTAKSAGQGGS